MTANEASPADHRAGPLPPGLLADYPWLTFVLPFAVFMLLTMLEPKPPDPAVLAGAPPGARLHADSVYQRYPLIHTFKLVATLGTMVLVLPGYRTFPLRVSPLALLVGLVGGVVWIWLSRLHLEAKLVEAVGLDGILKLGQRSAFDPWNWLSGSWAYGFLAIRFVGLVLIVPVMEEFFLRGFLMRYVMAMEWWRLPFGTANRTALVVGTAIPVLSHPEILAALVWFSAVTCLMLKTRNIWDCIMAHALTNLVLGVYVVATGHWELM